MMTGIETVGGNMKRATQSRTNIRNIIKTRQKAKAQQERTGLAFSVIFLIIIIGLIWATM